MKPIWIALLGLTVCATVLGAQADEKKRIADATTVIKEIMEAGDNSIPRSILEKAEGIAVFPSLLKGGLVVGG